MKKIFLLMMGLSLSWPVFGQNSISGTVTDVETGEPLVGATVRLLNTYAGAYTDPDGNYKIPGLKEGNYEVAVSYVGYETVSEEVSLSGKDLVVDFSVGVLGCLCDEIIIASLRAPGNGPTTNTTVTREEIADLNLGQDLPILLNRTPSVVTTSDAGTGIGYTGIRVRGSDPTRVNVTINGIPYNDSESQGTFWVNLPDFASSVEDIQIQRGVGSSTNGAGAFGGSINIRTDELREKPYGEVDNSVGSFGTRKHTLRAGTGLLNDHFAFNARLSSISSEGFIDRASSRLNSWFLNGGYYAKNTSFKVNIFRGNERTYQSWWGIPESRLESDAAGMQSYIANNFLDSADASNLLNSDPRTYNYYTYENEVDNYTQDHYQAIFAHQFNSKLSLNLAGHYTYGRGYFEQFRKQDDLGDYGLAPVVLGTDTVTTTDLIRRRWLENHFYGGTFSLNYQSGKKLSAYLGGAWNRYDGDHFGEIIWAEFASNSSIYDRYYDNTGLKTDFNVYAKADYTFGPRFKGFVDLQLRTIDYSFLGFDNNLENVGQEVNYLFFNPKAGLTWQLSGQGQMYGSYAAGSREPNRQDLTESSPDSRPAPEKLHNIELGYRHATVKYAFTANLYYMLYQDQLVLTGQVNDVGSYTRINVDNSYRRGIELDGKWMFAPKFSFNGNLTLSQNKIIDFSEFIFDYDTFTEVENELGNTDIAFSPSVIGGAGITWKPVKGLELNWFTKYVSRQYLDNTQNESRSLDPYLVSDVRATYTWKPSFAREIVFNVLVNNVTNTKYSSNGYTYGWIAGGQRLDFNHYFPQAGPNVLGGVSLKF